MPAAPYATEWGTGWVWFEDQAIRRLDLPGAPAPDAAAADVPQVVRDLCGRLERYFAGAGPLPSGREFASLAPTPFVRSVYEVVAAIPAGATMTYAQVACAVGRPGAARAVGAAMAANPFAPVIPCHRVVGSDARLRGYGGGLPMKESMLIMEAAG